MKRIGIRLTVSLDLNYRAKLWKWGKPAREVMPCAATSFPNSCLLDNRKRIAEKLQNPRILQISFKTLRHWKATAEYHRTKDILHVMRLLGHKNIKNTLVCAHMGDFGGDDFICRLARDVDEAKELVEGGFDYVTDMHGTKLFRKRK